MKEEKISVRSIAQRLGVSPATVSLALNGRRPTGFVTAATRKQVWDAAKEMGYPLERLRSRRAIIDRVGVFMISSPNPVYSETTLELCRALNQHRVQVLTFSFRSDREASMIARELHRKQDIDAAVFIGSRDEIVSTDGPAVYVGEVPVGSHVWQARVDNEGGGRLAAEYLWALGHRGVGVVLPGGKQTAGDIRLQGLRTYWEGQGSHLPDNRILHLDVANTSNLQARAAIADFLARERQSPNPITALFFFNDWMAGKVLKILRSQDIQVPEQLSVIGFDDSIYAELLDPPLTTIHNPFDKLGAMAAELLLEQAERPDAEPQTLVAPCRLIERQSCAPPPE